MSNKPPMSADLEKLRDEMACNPYGFEGTSLRESGFFKRGFNAAYEALSQPIPPAGDYKWEYENLCKFTSKFQDDLEASKALVKSLMEVIEDLRSALHWYESPIIHTLHIGDQVYDQECFEPTRKATEALAKADEQLKKLGVKE